MSSYNTVLLDDDHADLESLQGVLLSSRYAEDLRLRTVATVDELRSLVAQGDLIDVLFADIHLAGRQGAGIDLVAELFPRGCRTQVIYVSGYLEQATEVYETQHVYFLSKPVNPKKLDAALSQAIAALECQKSQWLEVKVEKRIERVDVATIRYIESNLRKAIIHTADRPDPVVVYRKLGDLQQQLPDSFVRCHGSFVVNLSRVVGLSATACTLDDGSAVPVSRSRAGSVKQSFTEYLHRLL